MNAIRTLIAALGVVAIAGISSASAAPKGFHITDPGTKTKVLDQCSDIICVKATVKKGDALRIKLEDVSTKQVKFFRVTFKDDASGQLVTKKIASDDGSTAVLKGLTAEKGKTHVFSVQACYGKGDCTGKLKFTFAS